MTANISIDALKNSYENKIFYLCVINSKKLFGLTEVSRADDDPEKGYQRLLETNRPKKIANYIDAGNLLPGAIVLSAQSGAIVKYDKKTQKLILSGQSKSLLVIDGQHRLYGAYQANNDIPMPVFIFGNLRREEEVQYFLDVNGLQRGVPKALRLELTKFTAKPESKEEQLLKIFTALDENSNSPLCGRMVRTKSVSGKLSHVSFQDSIKPLLEKPPMNVFSFEQKVSIITNFLLAVEDILINSTGDAKKISNAAFFQALMSIFVDACDKTFRKYSDYKTNSFKSCLSGIGDLDFENYSGTNKKSIKVFGETMRAIIIRDDNVSDDLF